MSYLWILMPYLWTYTFVLALLWWLFIVAKIHAYKFKNFSNRIRKVTKILFIFLILLTFLWYILIFLYASDKNINSDDFYWTSPKEVNY